MSPYVGGTLGLTAPPQHAIVPRPSRFWTGAARLHWWLLCQGHWRGGRCSPRDGMRSETIRSGPVPIAQLVVTGLGRVQSSRHCLVTGQTINRCLFRYNGSTAVLGWRTDPCPHWSLLLVSVRKGLRGGWFVRVGVGGGGRSSRPLFLIRLPAK